MGTRFYSSVVDWMEANLNERLKERRGVYGNEMIGGVRHMCKTLSYAHLISLMRFHDGYLDSKATHLVF